MTLNKPPVVGLLTPWDGVFRHTKFKRFDTGLIHGLAFVNEDEPETIEFLAVASYHPHLGHFRDFVTQLKSHYKLIRFWSMLNETLTTVLGRYGFALGFDIDEFGEKTDVMDWRKPTL